MRELWPLSLIARRRRAARFASLRALARATRSLYASSESFAPYRTVNTVQRAVGRDLPAALYLFVPAKLRAAAGKRAAQAVLASAQAQLVREAILSWHSPLHRAVLPVPPAVWGAWPRGRAAIDYGRSIFSFTVLLALFWLAGLRRYIQLARHMRASSRLPERPYIAVMNVSIDVVNCAAKGGLLNWLRNERCLEDDAAVVAVTSRPANGSEPAWLNLCDEMLPPIGRISPAFLLSGIAALALTPLLALFGFWQGLALLPDLIELQYVRQVNDQKLARTYLFLLGDQTRRPLWTFDVASRGQCTALLFYASSYLLFEYGAKVPEDIRHPSLLLNIWDECWFQTENARTDIAPALQPETVCKVVGAFDMVDSGNPLPSLPARAVAVYDVEPTASMLRLSQAGYILPTLTEEIIVKFWIGFAEAARALDFVIVHKPKRYGQLRHEWRYRQLLSSLEAEGRLVSLPPEFGPMRLMRQVVASVILPFTSVGDLAVGSGSKAFYFDSLGSIPQPEKYAGGTPVATGLPALTASLGECFERACAPRTAAAR